MFFPTSPHNWSGTGTLIAIILEIKAKQIRPQLQPSISY